MHWDVGYREICAEETEWCKMRHHELQGNNHLWEAHTRWWMNRWLNKWHYLVFPNTFQSFDRFIIIFFFPLARPLVGPPSQNPVRKLGKASFVKFVFRLKGVFFYFILFLIFPVALVCSPFKQQGSKILFFFFFHTKKCVMAIAKWLCKFVRESIQL